jgi:hypothetical protein
MIIYTRLNWPRIGSSGGHGDEPFGAIKDKYF